MSETHIGHLASESERDGRLSDSADGWRSKHRNQASHDVVGNDS